MTAPADLKEQLVRDEGGYQRFMYLDSKKIPTIGVGRNIRDKGLSHTEQDFMLNNDITESSAEVSAEIPWSIVSLDQVRREVLINLTFNMGISGLVTRNPKFLASLKAGDWQAAAADLLDGPYKNQVGERAYRLAEQIRSGARQ